jgi:hypothetical protein
MLRDSLPTKIVRLPAEVGKIEFKAFDSCDDFEVYAVLLALLKGLILDRSLPGRATIPDLDRYQLAAIQGFENEEVRQNANEVLQAAERALVDDLDVHLLRRLQMILER